MVIIGISFIILGGGLIALGYFFGGKFPEFFGFENGKITFGGGTVVEDTVQLSEFDKFEVRMDTSTVHVIHEGTEWKVEYALSKEPEITEKDGKVTIKETGNLISFWNFGSSKKRYVKLYIPADVKLIEEASINTDTGSVHVDKIDFDILRIKSDTGSVYVNAVAVPDAEIKTDTGSMHIDTFTCDKLLTKTSTGSQNFTNAKIEEIDAKTDTGSVKMEESMLTEGKIETDTGSIKLYVKGKLSDYEIHAKTDTGSVKVNGNKQGKKFESSGAHELKLECDTGSITIETED